MWFRRSKENQTLPIRNKALLEQAFTHRSYTEGELQASNERLEFLGDSVLGLIVSEYLCQNHPDWDQGHLSKARASLVRESTLARAAVDANLPPLLKLSPSEEASGGRERASILSDAFEAVVAAIYLDRGLEEARKFVLEHLQPALYKLERGEMPVHDHKSQLQELTQAYWRKVPSYKVVDEKGTPHRKTFVVEARVKEVVLGTGSGSSKKQAQQSAAANAIENINQNRRSFDDAIG